MAPDNINRQLAEYGLSVTKDFIRIINVNNNHWITLSNMLCGPGQVQVYESFNVTLSNVDFFEISPITVGISVLSLSLINCYYKGDGAVTNGGIRLRSSGRSVCLHLG